jgi:hypothetical protein
MQKEVEELAEAVITKKNQSIREKQRLKGHMWFLLLIYLTF